MKIFNKTVSKFSTVHKNIVLNKLNNLLNIKNVKCLSIQNLLNVLCQFSINMTLIEFGMWLVQVERTTNLFGSYLFPRQLSKIFTSIRALIHLLLLREFSKIWVLPPNTGTQIISKFFIKFIFFAHSEKYVHILKKSDCLTASPGKTA